MNEIIKKFKSLEALFAKELALQAVYLFGSLSEGKAHPKSDLDVGFLLDEVLVDQWPSLEEKWLTLLEKTFRKNVDLILVNWANTILKRHIIQGRCVWEKDSKVRRHFEMRSLYEYLDFKEDRKVVEEAFLKRLGVKPW